MSDIDSCVKKGFRSIGDSFRGEIWENCKRFKLLGGAYSSMPVEQRRHFDIATANHLRGPLKALKDPGVRTVIIIGATQVMKSIVGDIWCPFILEHDPRNLLGDRLEGLPRRNDPVFPGCRIDLVVFRFQFRGCHGNFQPFAGECSTGAS